MNFKVKIIIYIMVIYINVILKKNDIYFNNIIFIFY